MSMKMGRTTIGCCVLALLATGCASQHPPAEIVDTPVAEPAEVTAVDGHSGAGVCGLDGDAGRLPEDFAPTGVYVCEMVMIVVQGDEPLPAPSSTPVPPLTGDLGPLLAALAVPNGPSSVGACTEEARIVPTLWFVDDDGRAARIAYPVDGCGKPRTERVDDALAELRRG